MALFKIHKGTGTFPAKATEGYCYFNSETGRFAIDIADAATATTTQRKLINPDAFVGVSRSGATWTFTTADGSTKILTQQDNNTNYYHTRVYSSGLKISTGTGVSDMYIPTGDAYQTWGGQVLSGTISPVDAAASNLHSANRFAFANPAGITIQYSTNSGSSWTDYGASNEDKKALVSNINSNFYIGKASGTGKNTTAHQLRVILNATNMGVYTRLQKLLIYINTNYATGCQVKIEKAMKGSESTFTALGTYGISGWSGWNSIPIGIAFGGGSTQTSNIAVLRLTFSVTGINSSQNSALTLINLVGIGDTYWTYPSQMSYDGHLYSYDVNQNMYIPGHIYLQGASESSSTANTTQLVFGTKDNNHVVISSNKNALVINPTLTSTEKQIVLYLNQPSLFPSGITGNLNGLASKATADANGANISTTYAKLAGNNTFTGKNIFTASNSYNTLDTQKFIVGNSSSAFVFGGDGMQCFSGTSSTTGKDMYLQYYGGSLKIGKNGVMTIDTDGNISAKYLQGTWLKTTATTAVTSTGRYAVLSDDGWVYYMTPANVRQHLNNISNQAYNAIAVCYQGGTAPTYYRITFPDSQDALWGMYNLEVLLRQAYGSGTGGKVLINAHHANNASSWSTLTASVEGNLTTDIKVYASGTKYLYIAGCSPWSTAAILNLIVGDGATNVDLSNISIDIVAELPSGYQTASMYYSLNSNNYTSYTVTQTGGGASGTWGINVTGSAGSVAWGNITGKPTSFTPASHTHSYLPLSGGSLSGPLQINTSIQDHSSPTAHCLVINSSTTPSGTTLGLKNAPGIGFHIANVSWGSMIFDGAFRFINNTSTGYMPVYASTFYGNLSGNATSATSADGVKARSKLTSTTVDGFMESGIMKWAPADNTSVGTNDGIVLSLGFDGTYGAQLWFDDGSGEGGIKIRSHTSSAWNPWRQVLSENNYNDYAPSKTGAGASGSWGISVTGSAGSVAWGNITGKPSFSYLPLAGGTMTGHITMNGSNQVKSANTGSSYWKARDLALVRHTAHTASSSYSPIYSMKGLSGDFACGLIHYSSGESKIEWRYTTDATYNAGLNDGSSLLMSLDSAGSLSANKVYGAVWNDYAEYRSGASTEPGKVVKECSDGILRITESRLEPGCEIISDTFGFAIGETDECKTPIAASGRVLAYPFEDRDTFELGQAVCSGPNGTVSKMTREEVMMYPERIIGTVSEIPQYEIWGTGNVAVNGRIWIRIR